MRTILSVVFGVAVLLFVIPPASGEDREIGSWENRNREERGIISLIMDEKETYVLIEFKTGITIRQPVKTSRKGKSVVYKPTNTEVEEYYIIDQDKNLELWDRLGLKQTLAPE